MSSIRAQVADLLKTALNASTFSMQFRAERRPLAENDLEDLSELTVSVVPATYARQPEDRGADLRTFSIDIGIQKRLTPGINPITSDANPEVDALLLLQEELGDLIRPRTSPDVHLKTFVDAIRALGVRWSSSQTSDPMFDPKHLRDNKTFTAVVRHTFAQSIEF